jgi:hypothetical protein
MATRQQKKAEKPEAVPQDKIKEPSQPKPKIDEPTREKKQRTSAKASTDRHPRHQGYHGTDDERTLNPEE